MPGTDPFHHQMRERRCHPWLHQETGDKSIQQMPRMIMISFFLRSLVQQQAERRLYLEQSTPTDRGLRADTGQADQLRITSYNVCYTKLLRLVIELACKTLRQILLALRQYIHYESCRLEKDVMASRRFLDTGEDERRIERHRAKSRHRQTVIPSISYNFV